MDGSPEVQTEKVDPLCCQVNPIAHGCYECGIKMCRTHLYYEGSEANWCKKCYDQLSNYIESWEEKILENEKLQDKILELESKLEEQEGILEKVRELL